MTYLKTKIMAIPQESFDLMKVIAWLIGAVTFIWSFSKFVDSYFASKKREKQEFIVSVVKATMDSCLQDIKKDILEIRGDVKHFNETVVKIYTDFK